MILFTINEIYSLKIYIKCMVTIIIDNDNNMIIMIIINGNDNVAKLS